MTLTKRKRAEREETKKTHAVSIGDTHLSHRLTHSALIRQPIAAFVAAAVAVSQAAVATHGTGAAVEAGAT